MSAQFARLFRGDTGESPARFTERVQAEAARCTLEQADLPIETVAKECGFARPCGRIPENIGQGIPESLFR